MRSVAGYYWQVVPWGRPEAGPRELERFDRGVLGRFFYLRPLVIRGIMVNKFGVEVNMVSDHPDWSALGPIWKIMTRDDLVVWVVW